MTWTTRPRSESGAIEAGQGPRIVLLHGVGLRAEAWGAQIEGLSDGYRVVAPDMPGHGTAEMPQVPMTLDNYVRAAQRHLHPAPCILVGHSMGAMIALALAARHPKHVVGVVAMNAIFRRSVEAARAVRARADALDGQSMADPTGTLLRWFGNVQTAQSKACDSWLREVDPKGYRAAYRVFAHHDGPPDALLQGLTCSALFLTGGQEPNSTPDMSFRMADLAPKGAAHVVGSAAHMLPMTHAAEVNACLRAFADTCFAQPLPATLCPKV